MLICGRLRCLLRGLLHRHWRLLVGVAHGWSGDIHRPTAGLRWKEWLWHGSAGGWRLLRDLGNAGRVDDGTEKLLVDEAQEKKRLEDGKRDLRGLAQKLSCLCGIRGDQVLHLRQDIQELRGRKRREGFRDCVGAGQVGRRVCARWKRRQSRALCHVLTILHLLRLLLSVAGGRIVACAIVVGVVDSELATHELIVVEVAHRRGSVFGVGEFCETEALGPAAIFVVDESEAEDLADATEGFDDELLAHAIGYVADEDDPAAFLRRHVDEMAIA